MKIKFSMSLAAASLLLIVMGAMPAQAQIVNGSFETGDLTGWTASPGDLVSVTNSYQGDGPVFTAVDGSEFAVLSAGAGANVYTTLSQTFAANAGDTLSGDAFFQANDYLPFDDDGYVKIIENGQVLFSSDVAAVGNFGNTPWTAFSYTFASGGDYTIQAGVENDLDNDFASDLGLDAVTLTPSVVSSPEPSSIAAFVIAGLGLVMLTIRAKRNRRINA